MGIFNYSSKDNLSYTCEGWFIKFRLPYTKDGKFNGDFDIEKTRNNNNLNCFCSSGCGDKEWEVISEWQISDYPLGYLFNTKEDALEKFNKLVKSYGKNLKYEDIFVSIHHCEIEHNFKYL